METHYSLFLRVHTRELSAGTLVAIKQIEALENTLGFISYLMVVVIKDAISCA